MERYQLTRDKDSGITNNPNDWSDDPRYILDLVKGISKNRCRQGEGFEEKEQK
jgi:predicted helicase